MSCVPTELLLLSEGADTESHPCLVITSDKRLK